MPARTERIILPSGTPVDVQVSNPKFRAWAGEPVSNTFGGKPLLDVNGEPAFAELAILDLFIKEGWSGRWVETYGASTMRPYYFTSWLDRRLKDQIHDPLPTDRDWTFLEKIQKLRVGHSGYWDVMVWNNESIVFAEAKHSKKDSINETQVAWLEAALTVGISLNNFLIVEWSYTI